MNRSKIVRHPLDMYDCEVWKLILGTLISLNISKQRWATKERDSIGCPIIPHTLVFFCMFFKNFIQALKLKWE